MLRGGTKLTLGDSFPGDLPPWQEVTVALLGSRPRSSPPLGIFLVSFQVAEVRKGRGGRREGMGEPAWPDCSSQDTLAHRAGTLGSSRRRFTSVLHPVKAKGRKTKDFSRRQSV